MPDWENDNFRKDSISVSDTVQLNAGVILPDKFMITDEAGNPVSELFYEVDYANSQIIFDESLSGQKLFVSYYIHPDLQRSSVFSKDTALIIEPTQEHKYYAYGEDLREVRKPFDGLNSRGSLVRGIRFGNNQSASVQSSLDLQLTGN